MTKPFGRKGGQPPAGDHEVVSSVLQQCRYHPPKTHDATACDAYYGKVADKVLQQIKLSGWLIEAPQTLQKNRRRNESGTDEGLLCPWHAVFFILQ
jgi:hypothetical protein